MGGPSGMLGADRSSWGTPSSTGEVVRRVLRFARPYRWLLVGYLAVIIAIALIQLVPPLIFRQIIDEAIPRGITEGDSGQLHLLAGVAVAAAVGSAAMAIVERWPSSRIGEGVIYDLRVAVFGHVQRMPISLLHPHPDRGADQPRSTTTSSGAQRALTTTIGGVASNVITLVTTLIAMALLEWQLTLLSLVVLPLFIVPARRVGRRLQAVTRTQMDLNASMNTTMTERFNVSGALLVKLFGADRGRGGRSPSGRRRARHRNGRALYGRTFFIASASSGPSARPPSTGWAAAGHQRHAVARHAGGPGRLRDPALRAADRPDQRPRRLAHRDGVVRAGVRGARRPLPLVDRRARSSCVARAGASSFDDVHFRYPDRWSCRPRARPDRRRRPARSAPTPVAPVARGRNGERGDGRTAAAWRLAGPRDPRWGVRGRRAGPARGAGRADRAAARPRCRCSCPRLYDVTEGAVRVDGHDVRDLTQDSLHAAIGAVTQDPHLFHDTVGNNLRYARPDATDAELVTAARAARSTTSSRRCPRATTPWSASGATACRAARSSAWRSPACC